MYEPTAEAVADKIRASGGVARSSDASVTDRGAVHRLFRDVVTEFGALDIVINKAGILRFPSFLDAEQDDWVAVLDVHFNGGAIRGRWPRFRSEVLISPTGSIRRCE